MTAPLGDLIRDAEGGDATAADQLFALLYRELHELAEHQLRRRSDLTLGTTTLLHETYLNVAAREGIQFATRKQFLAYASRAMRGLVIDYSRRRQAKKRGGEFQITTSLEEVVADTEPGGDLEGLAAALEAMARLDPELAQLVDLHFFCGFSFAEVAALRGVSERTVGRDWRAARLLLHRLLRERPAGL